MMCLKLLQGALQVPADTRKIETRSTGTSNERIVGLLKPFLMKTAALANKAFDAVPDYGSTDFFTGGYTNTHRTAGAVTSNDDEMACRNPLPLLIYGEVIPTFTETKRLWKRVGMLWSGQLLGCNGYRQFFAPFGTTTLDHQPAVLGRHADKEAVGALAGCIARLKGPFHILTPYAFFILSGNVLYTC